MSFCVLSSETCFSRLSSPSRTFILSFASSISSSVPGLIFFVIWPITSSDEITPRSMAMATLAVISLNL